MPSSLIETLRLFAREQQMPDRESLIRVLDADSVSLDDLLSLAEEPRQKYFGNKVQVHILDNIRNGYCAEDCGYCAQRKSAKAEEIPAYAAKDTEEILKEAESAYRSGAYRFCLVTSGTGPTPASVERYAELIRQIKTKFPMRLCLSAGIIKDANHAKILAAAGLDRYNHNLNTSEDHTPNITKTHTFQDRVATIRHLHDAGISVCSGVIAGMGESKEDLVDVALRLRQLEVPSIPVNFFLPVPGHEVKNPSPLTAEYCIRVLCMFRIANPSAEIRMAAGREVYIGASQPRALRAANSLFVSGYLNVKGSDAAETYAMIERAGYRIDAELSDLDADLRERLKKADAEAASAGVIMKTREDLRAFAD